MGKRGPAPKPTKLKILSGNPGKRPLNPREPRPASGPPACPSWLPAEAKAEWRRVVKELAGVGLLTKADRASLTAYCLAWARMRAASKTLETEGDTCTNDKTGVSHAHPAVGMLSDALRQVKAYAALFGLDPASRSRLSTGEAAPVDELEAFLGRKRG